MTAEQNRVADAVLRNAESMSDDEMVEYFTECIGLTADEARAAVAERDAKAGRI